MTENPNATSTIVGYAPAYTNGNSSQIGNATPDFVHKDPSLGTINLLSLYAYYTNYYSHDDGLYTDIELVNFYYKKATLTLTLNNNSSDSTSAYIDDDKQFNFYFDSNTDVFKVLIQCKANEEVRCTYKLLLEN